MYLGATVSVPSHIGRGGCMDASHRSGGVEGVVLMYMEQLSNPFLLYPNKILRQK